MFVSVLMVRALLHACGARGIARSDLLAGSALLDADLSDLRVRLPSVDFERIAQRALALTGDAALGLSLGAELPQHALQVVGYLVQSSPTLRHAYTAFARYASLLAVNPLWVLREEADTAVLSFRCVVPHPSTERLAHDWAASLTYRSVAAFASRREHRPTRVELAFPEPDEVASYAALFPCAVRFGLRDTTVHFPRALLDVPQLHGDPAMWAALRDTAERFLQHVELGSGMAGRMRGELRKAGSLAGVTVTSLARSLGVSESTLRRTLASEGISPSELVDEARCERACAFLQEPQRAVKDVAFELGYADVTSFHRAFKRWTGVTPVAYRERFASAPPAL